MERSVASVGSRVVSCLVLARGLAVRWMRGACAAKPAVHPAGSRGGVRRGRQGRRRPARQPALACAEGSASRRYIEKVRQLAAAARPPARPRPCPTIEGQDAELSSARLLRRSGARAPRAIAGSRRRTCGSACSMPPTIISRPRCVWTPTDAASFDGLARVWRDWGLPNVGARRRASCDLLRPILGDRVQHAWHHPPETRVRRRRPNRRSKRPCSATRTRPMR